MPSSIKLIECPRDAWQGLPGHIPTPLKVEYLQALINAGFRHIDAASFVSPKAVPQMADSETVLSELDPPDDVEIIGIVVNERGAERAIATDAVHTLGFPYSLSPTFLEAKPESDAGRKPGNAGEDQAEGGRERPQHSGLYLDGLRQSLWRFWNAEELIEGIRLLADMDLQAISLADTVGLATPEQIGDLLDAVYASFSDIEIGVHLHSRPDDAIAKVLAAYDSGCRRFDSAIGGMGGCPFAQDVLVGNIPTEKLLEALKQRDVAPPVSKPITEPFRFAVDIASRFSGPKM